MLNIHLLVVGEKMPRWVEEGYAEYEKRIRGRIRLHLLEIPAIKRGKNADIKRIVQREEQKVVSAIPNGAHVIALDRIGKALSTTDISAKMDQWLQQGRPIALMVGGPEGFSSQLLKQADETWSLSALTFAHPLVRVMLAEQIYRCYSILEGLPYHR
ncbi:MAG: 23S rRNA (pseudouridine(1915)-N(3))-methyltransferase RlmH [Gammaproteobacteria bacterium]|nr:23S rRNA (pseudouridine(1915)-N(3))-methyltransferase RlmH [Gammaproteobacteria bacterium]